jgi:hypothetical protein
VAPAYQSDSSSRPAITIEQNTTDTGERKQFFGRMARHLVTHITRSDGPDTVTDAWYVDDPRLPSLRRSSGNTVAVLTAGVGRQKPVVPRIEVKQTGPVPILHADSNFVTRSSDVVQANSDTPPEATALRDADIDLFQTQPGTRNERSGTSETERAKLDNSFLG